MTTAVSIALPKIRPGRITTLVVPEANKRVTITPPVSTIRGSFR